LRRGDGGFACLNLLLSMALPLRTHIAGYPRERNSFGSEAAFAARLGVEGLQYVAHRGHFWFNPEMQGRSVPAQRRSSPVQIPPSAPYETEKGSTGLLPGSLSGFIWCRRGDCAHRISPSGNY